MKKVDVNVTKLERPMDIVVRTRANGISQAALPAVPKQRMTITYLVLTNFKSYAGQQVVGPFHASFSSVVGPNGSGKSNSYVTSAIADSSSNWHAAWTLSLSRSESNHHTCDPPTCEI